MTDRALRDLRLASRTLRREPGFTLAIVGTFAIAMGANAAMFGLVSRLMLAAPAGIDAPERVARVTLAFGGQDAVMSTTSFPAFRAIAESRGFAAATMARSDTVDIGRGAGLERVAAVEASGDYFRVLGATPHVGRFFGPADDELPIGNPVVVLSHGYWARRFASDPRVIGRSIFIQDSPFTVIGVARRGFNGDELGAVDVFLPLAASLRNFEAQWWSNTGLNLGAVLVRLDDGVPPSLAAQTATTALGQLAARDGGPVTAQLESVIPGSSSRQSPQARIALWLAGVSLVVLLIASANAGTLLLLRGERRRRDVAVRRAIGATWRDLASQVLAESLMLACAGSGAGLLLSGWFADLLRVTLLPNVAPSDIIADRRVLLASLAAAAMAGLLAGASPLMQLARRDVASDLRAGGHVTSARASVRTALVSLQVALCMILVVGAGLFVRSLQRVTAQDLGFSTTSLLHVELEFRGSLGVAERNRVYDESIARVRALPGVINATPVQGIPFGAHNIPPISVPGWTPPPPWEAQLPIMYATTPAYLSMMRVGLRRGRLFTDADARGAPLVVLVNETMARSVWPGESPIGKCVRAGFYGAFPPPDENANPAAAGPCREVVGVVRDSRARSLRPERGEAALMQYYVPFGQLPPAPFDAGGIMGMLVQVSGDADRSVSRVQRLIQSATAVPVYARVRPYQDFLGPQLRSWRLGAVVFSVFGALALGIAALGLFGVIAYVVQQRTREIGVRLALGGTPTDMGRMVVRDAVRLVSIGLAAGSVMAMLAAPLVRDLLFQTSPYEPASLMAAVALLLLVTILASAWPAWRAGTVDPMVTLRASD